ncbi:MAG TPA: gliding motility-associated C-terminal domain-containing protein [Niastella sp.]
MRKILRGHVFNKKFLFTLCLGLTWFVEAHAQVSGTFTINSAVATGGSNFQTFSAAVAFLSGGVNGAVVFNVQAGSGPYNEQVIINNISGTSATNTITFNGNGETLSFLSTNSSQRACIKLNNTDYVTFDNLTVTALGSNVGEYGYGFHLLNDADNNTIKNCRITTTLNVNVPESTEGIVVNGNNDNSLSEGYSNCDNNLIQGNVINGGSVGITLASKPVGSNPVVYISGNRILNNAISNFSYYGIQLCYNSGTQVDRNEITGGGLNLNKSSGIFINNNNQSLAATNNRIHDLWVDPSKTGNELHGILINSVGVAGNESLIANNLIYNLQSNGIQYGIAFRSGISSYFNIYHNTISIDDQTMPGIESYGIYLDQVTDVTVRNNIATLTRPGTVRNIGIYTGVLPVRLKSDNNCIYVKTGIASVCAYGYYSGNQQYTITNWRTFTGQDQFSTDIDPVYTNLAGFNFTPTAQNADNMAVYVSINTDINSAARNTTNPDPGCLEFTSAPCSASVLAGTGIVTPDSNMCMGPKMAIGLRGNTAGSGQTYTWQTSTTQSGTYSNLTGPIGYPYYEGTPTTTLYYRAAVTCGAVTAYSSPIRVLVTSALNNGTYTINSALPTGGINFNSFSDAVRALQCGINGNVVFNVASGSGPYTEQVIIPVVNTSPSRTVTFNGNGETITFQPTVSTESAVIKLRGADYITIDSLNVDVKSATTYGFGIQLMNDADHNTIKRCTVNLNKTSTSLFFAGIVMNGDNVNPKNPTNPSNCDSNLIANNKVNGGHVGITCVSKSDTGTALITPPLGNIIRKNTIKDNTNFGIYVAGTENLVIDSNDISIPTRTVFNASLYGGIYVYFANFRLTISRNKIHNLLDNLKTSILQLEGIRFETVVTTPDKPQMVSNNALYNWRGNGVQEGLYAINSSNIKFYHNTVSLEDTTTSTSSSATRGFALFGTVLYTGNELRDNSITIKRGGNGPKYCIYLSNSDSGLAANYNNYYMKAAGGTNNNVGYMGGIPYPTLTNWLATRKDANSITMDPVFHDMANGDLTPTKIPFENKGTNVGISNDIWDVTRNTTNPDIGAFEFTICRNLTAPVLSMKEAGVNTITFSWPAVQYTSGYRVSLDSITWTIPSSGAMGTTHTITGLQPAQSVNLIVKALGSRVDCPEYYSQWTEGKTITDGVFVPNTFTPNGDSHNDVFKVYSNVMASVRWMVFNQWGEKVFESNDTQSTWDGNYKGKPQPIGVYVYVVAATLVDGTNVTKKGSFNLIR